jgi:hypothetical protein
MGEERASRPEWLDWGLWVASERVPECDRREESATEANRALCSLATNLCSFLTFYRTTIAFPIPLRSNPIVLPLSQQFDWEASSCI